MCAEALARPGAACVHAPGMTAVDWIIVAFVALMALWGYAQGLIVSALSLAGFAAGAFAGSRLAPLLLDQGSSSPYAPLFSLVTALDGRRLRRDPLRGAGGGDPAADVIPRRGRAGRHRRCAAGRHARARAGVDRRGRRAPDARRARAAAGHPALGDPLEAERGAAAVRPPPERPGARRPVPTHPRARGRRARAHAAHPARRRRAGTRMRASCGFSARLRARRAGVRLGGGARDRGHERARRGR